jgi:xanthine dehydrogenase accessory factor
MAPADFYRRVAQANARGERVVVATVAHTQGSTPQRSGAKMVFFESGEIAGTVGGGSVEAEVGTRARETFRTGQCGLHRFSLMADEASDDAMLCGGAMEIFLDVWDPQRPAESE